MFGFGKESKTTKLIGTSLHSQLHKALQEDESMTNQRLMSTFTNGYIMGFIHANYTLAGLDGSKQALKHSEEIIQGVHPRLAEYIIRTGELMALKDSANGFKKLSMAEERVGIDVNPCYDPDYYEKGLDVGSHDARISLMLNGEAVNWYWWLTGQERWKEKIINKNVFKEEWETFGDYFRDFKRYASAVNPEWSPGENGDSPLDHLDETPLRKAYKDCVDPERLGREYGEINSPYSVECLEKTIARIG